MDNKQSFIIPPHSNKLFLSIICTLFYCIIPGVVAIAYSSKSNSLYSSAMMTGDDSMKAALYYQSEKKNNTARTWLVIGIVFGLIWEITTLILALTGELATLGLY